MVGISFDLYEMMSKSHVQKNVFLQKQQNASFFKDVQMCLGFFLECVCNCTVNPIYQMCLCFHLYLFWQLCFSCSQLVRLHGGKHSKKALVQIPTGTSLCTFGFFHGTPASSFSLKTCSTDQLMTLNCALSVNVSVCACMCLGCPEMDW